jgi:hypothetical protein
VSNWTASSLRDQGGLDAARPVFERALAISEKVLGPEHPHTAVSLNDLAFSLRDQGDLAGARPLFERALAIHEKVLLGALLLQMSAHGTKQTCSMADECPLLGARRTLTNRCRCSTSTS